MKKNNNYASDMANELSFYNNELKMKEKLDKNGIYVLIGSILTGIISGGIVAGLFMFGGDCFAKSLVDDIASISKFSESGIIVLSSLLGSSIVAIPFIGKMVSNMKNLNKSEPKINGYIEEFKQNFPEFKEISPKLLREGLTEVIEFAENKEVVIREKPNDGEFHFEENANIESGLVTVMGLVIPNGKDLDTNLEMGTTIQKANNKYYNSNSQYSFVFGHGQGFINNEPTNIFVTNEEISSTKIEVKDEVINRVYGRENLKEDKNSKTKIRKK